MPELYATCPSGLERPLAEELRALGARRVRPLTGLVSCEGELAVAYRSCLWSHLASRVVVVLARFDAADSDALYEGMAGVAWECQLAPGATFAIDAHGTNASLRSTRFVAERAKDAVCDRMVARVGVRPRVDTVAPDVVVALRLSGRRASAGVVLSGARPLFERGYEAMGGIPSLRADYACALLSLAGTPLPRPSGPQTPGAAPGEGRGALVVGWAGGGALAVEAARAVRGQAPGLALGRGDVAGWLGHDRAAWERERDVARERLERGDAAATLVAFDHRGGADAALRHALVAAGLPADAVRLVGADELGRLDPAWDACAADLSWARGDLAREAGALPWLGTLVGGAREGATLAVAGSPELADALPLACARRVDTRIGSAGAALGAWELPAGDGLPRLRLPDGFELVPLVPQSDQFAARLAKMARQRAKWARRELVDAYRVYDADLPDYNLAIDLLNTQEPRGGRYAVVSEYAPPADVDASLARRRLADALAVTAHVLGVDPAHVRVRVRERARGGSQYADEDRSRHGRGERVVVEEGGLSFELDLARRHDFGLFLDQRDTRALVRELMKRTPGGRFLNLFCYTGSATVYAADGGAGETVSVDLSRPSLDVARRNLARNGFAGPEHQLVQADVLSWVDERRHERGAGRFDLVFCDVPTFSNSARMRRRSFDVDRDHAELIIAVSRLLAPGGACLFSCNLRRFAPDADTLARAGVSLEDLTAQTIPEDFARTPRVHHAYLVRRVPRRGPALGGSPTTSHA